MIIGALVEVLLTDSSTHKFVRSIYAFFVLFVIAAPLPALFRDASHAVQTGGAVELDTELMRRMHTQTAAALGRTAQRALEQAGFGGVIVTIVDGTVYVNALGLTVSNGAGGAAGGGGGSSAGGGADASRKNQSAIIEIVSAVTGAAEGEIHYVG